MATSTVTEEDFSSVVTTIRVTIHTLGYVFDDDKGSANHASILLITSLRPSVRLNMTKKRPTDTRGTYEQRCCGYIKFNSSLAHFDLQPSPGLTVATAIEILHQRGRKNYTPAPSDVGSRFWVQTVINDWAETQLIDPSSPMSASAVMDALRYSYSKDQEPVFDEIEPGTFV